MKSQMIFDDLLKKPHYANIIAVLRVFGNKKEGLRQAHLRYVLMKDPKMHWYTERAMKEFFGDELEGAFNPLPLINQPFLKKGCIKTRKQLDNYLRQLVKMGIVKKDKRGSYAKYTVADKYSKELERTEVLDKIKWWNTSLIIKMKETKFTINSQQGYDSITMFGLPFESYTKEEMEVIQKCLSNILMNARELLQMKCKKMQIKIKFDDLLKKARRSFKEGKSYLEQEYTSSAISMFYTGEMDYLIY